MVTTSIPTPALTWDLEYRTTPFVSVRQTGWDTFCARAECWGGIELGMDPATLQVFSMFAAPTTATRAYEGLSQTMNVARPHFEAALHRMLETGVLGMAGELHRRLVPKVIDKVRVGRPFDGGYVVPADFATMVDGLLAFGVGDDLSFENDFCDRHPGRTLAFDHTIDAPPYRRARVEFVPKGLATSASATMTTLDKLLSKGPFERPMIKMDIEGAEWKVLASCSDRVFERVPIMVFELHGMLANTPMQNLVLTRLLAHHEPVHVHANNVGPVLDVAGHAYPEWLEVTFLRRDLIDVLEPDRGAYPTRHDYPNWSGGADVALGWWNAARSRRSGART